MGDIKRFEHIIVLMLENRSFDHMLGMLDHPNKPDHADAFLTGNESNQQSPPPSFLVLSNEGMGRATSPRISVARSFRVRG